MAVTGDIEVRILRTLTLPSNIVEPVLFFAAFFNVLLKSTELQPTPIECPCFPPNVLVNSKSKNCRQHHRLRRSCADPLTLCMRSRPAHTAAVEFCFWVSELWTCCTVCVQCVVLDSARVMISLLAVPLSFRYCSVWARTSAGTHSRGKSKVYRRARERSLSALTIQTW